MCPLEAYVWKNNQDFFQKELQIVFSIAFSTCGRINWDITKVGNRKSIPIPESDT